MSILHIGHVLFSRSHWSMQLLWNWNWETNKTGLRSTFWRRKVTWQPKPIVPNSNHHMARVNQKDGLVYLISVVINIICNSLCAIMWSCYLPLEFCNWYQYRFSPTSLHISLFTMTSLVTVDCAKNQVLELCKIGVEPWTKVTIWLFFINKPLSL